MFGEGPLSDPISQVASSIPSQMSAVSVSENGTLVVFNWTAPASLNGQPLLGY